MTGRLRLANPVSLDEGANSLFPTRIRRSVIADPIPARRLPKGLRAAVAAEGTTR